VGFLAGEATQGELQGELDLRALSRSPVSLPRYRTFFTPDHSSLDLQPAPRLFPLRSHALTSKTLKGFGPTRFVEISQSYS